MVTTRVAITFDDIIDVTFVSTDELCVEVTIITDTTMEVDKITFSEVVPASGCGLDELVVVEDVVSIELGVLLGEIFVVLVVLEVLEVLEVLDVLVVLVVLEVLVVLVVLVVLDVLVVLVVLGVLVVLVVLDVVVVLDVLDVVLEEVVVDVLGVVVLLDDVVAVVGDSVILVRVAVVEEAKGLGPGLELELELLNDCSSCFGGITAF